MRNVILNRNRKTWGSADTRLTHQAFYEPTINHKIATRELGGWGGVPFNDFVDRLWHMGELKYEKGTKCPILPLESLIIGHRMGRNSAANPKISVSLADSNAKTLIYGKRRKSGADSEIAE